MSLERDVLNETVCCLVTVEVCDGHKMVVSVQHYQVRFLSKWDRNLLHADGIVSKIIQDFHKIGQELVTVDWMAVEVPCSSQLYYS